MRRSTLINNGRVIRSDVVGTSVKNAQTLPGWNPDNIIDIKIPSQGEDLIDFPLLINLSDSSGVTDFDCSAVFDELGTNNKKISIEYVATGEQCYTEIESWESKTKFLLHSDDTDGSTTFTDSSFSQHTINRFGNTQHSTVQSKVGTSSIYFDGNGDCLKVGASEDFNIGTGDFTVECWYMPTGRTTSYPRVWHRLAQVGIVEI